MTSFVCSTQLNTLLHSIRSVQFGSAGCLIRFGSAEAKKPLRCIHSSLGIIIHQNKIIVLKIDSRFSLAILYMLFRDCSYNYLCVMVLMVCHWTRVHVCLCYNLFDPLNLCFQILRSDEKFKKKLAPGFGFSQERIWSGEFLIFWLVSVVLSGEPKARVKLVCSEESNPWPHAHVSELALCRPTELVNRWLCVEDEVYDTVYGT